MRVPPVIMKIFGYMEDLYDSKTAVCAYLAEADKFNMCKSKMFPQCTKLVEIIENARYNSCYSNTKDKRFP